MTKKLLECYHSIEKMMWINIRDIVMHQIHGSVYTSIQPNCQNIPKQQICMCSESSQCLDFVLLAIFYSFFFQLQFFFLHFWTELRANLFIPWAVITWVTWQEECWKRKGSCDICLTKQNNVSITTLIEFYCNESSHLQQFEFVSVLSVSLEHLTTKVG